MLCCFAFQGPDISSSYLPEFVAKMEPERNPLPRSFLIKLLMEFVGDLPEEQLLCPVKAVQTYLDATASLAPRSHSLFVSPHCPSRSFSKNVLSYFLRQVISSVGAITGDQISLPRAPSIRGVATSAAFLCNWSVSKVLEVASWRSNPVFASLFIFILLRMSFTPSAHLSWWAPWCNDPLLYSYSFLFQFVSLPLFP